MSDYKSELRSNIMDMLVTASEQHPEKLGRPDISSSGRIPEGDTLTFAVKGTRDSLVIVISKLPETPADDEVVMTFTRSKAGQTSGFYSATDLSAERFSSIFQDLLNTKITTAGNVTPTTGDLPSIERAGTSSAPKR